MYFLGYDLVAPRRAFSSDSNEVRMMATMWAPRFLWLSSLFLTLFPACFSCSALLFWLLCVHAPEPSELPEYVLGFLIQSLVSQWSTLELDFFLKFRFVPGGDGSRLARARVVRTRTPRRKAVSKNSSCSDVCSTRSSLPLSSKLLSCVATPSKMVTSFFARVC